MKSKIAQKILGGTPQDTKEKVRTATSRRIELYKLGFKEVDNQQTFCLYKFDSSWYVDFWKLTGYNEHKWNTLIEDIKYDVEMTRISYFGGARESEEYQLARKDIKKELMDIYNNLNSKFKEGTSPKLDRRGITEDGIRLEAQVELLKKLIRDL